MVADHAVVSYVRVRHNQDVAADLGYAATLGGASVDGDALADVVVVAHLQRRALAVVGDILRIHADGTERVKGVAGADLRRPHDVDVRDQPAAIAQLDLVADDAIGADAA